MGLFGSGASATAPYPASQYPASSFFGAANLTPNGANAKDDNQMSPNEKRNVIIVVLIAVALGYALFHFNYVR
jgi:hypothetical protein